MRSKSLAHLWMQAHNYLAVFFLPVALLYAVTGGLYIMGIHGSTSQQTIETATDPSQPKDPNTLKTFVQTQLQGHNMPAPQGEVQSVHGRFFWGHPTASFVTLETDQRANTAQI